MVGFTSRIPGTNRLLDALRWDRGVNPREWQVYDTVFDRAAAQGTPATIVSRREFEGSGLTEASQRGARFVGADSLGERISAVVRASAASGSLTYVYEGELDATGHRSGSHSWAWDHQLATVDYLRAEAARGPSRSASASWSPLTTGWSTSSPEGRLDVDEPEFVSLLDGVELFGGEARFRHLYCAPGSAADVVARWRDRLGANAWVVSRDEAIAEGWFGAVDSHVRPRLGDVMVASRGQTAVVSSRRFAARELADRSARVVQRRRDAHTAAGGPLLSRPSTRKIRLSSRYGYLKVGSFGLRGLGATVRSPWTCRT